MKKKILLFTLIAGFGVLAFSSWNTGVAFTAGYDCTGAETGLGNPTGCSVSGGGCHDATANTGIIVAIELDSAGVATTHYKGGMSYTIKVTGTNSSASALTNLSMYGVQVGVITGSVAATTPTNAGTFGTPPTNTHLAAATSGSYVLNLIENSARMSPASGTGGTGTTYVTSIPWTAPASGTGTISIWSALNAVNDNNLSTGDAWNLNHVAIGEWATPSSVANVMNNISVIAFPNPVSNTLQLQMDETTEGTYALQVFGMDGRMVANDNIAVSGKSYTTSLNTSNWTPGMYSIVLSKDGGRKVIAVVKQ